MHNENNNKTQTPAANARRKRLPLISDVGSYLV